MASTLEGVEFRDPARGRAVAERLGKRLPPRAAERLYVLLGSVPDPDRAADCLETLAQENPAAFERVSSSPASLRGLVAVFSYSHFLSDAVLKNPGWILQVAESGSFYRALTVEEFQERLAGFLTENGAGGVPPALLLARFRRRQLLRIVLRDVLGVADLSDVTGELSNLADATLDLAYRRIREDLVARHGTPRLAGGEPAGFSVIALGKLGGRELNYSSDIDLMFVYSGGGETDSAAPIANKEFFKKLANEFTALLSTYTADGMCYRVDLRLRPDGRLGEVSISVDGAREYYETRGRDWEKQMLIKARVAAGEAEPGAALLESIEPLIYQSSLDFSAVEAVSETRQRIGEKSAARRRLAGGPDIKLAPGGIRDVEFLVQCLQRLHGGREPWVRHGGTLFALFRLRDKNLLSGVEYARLAAAYQFYRYLEHRLQFLDDRQTHSLPTGADELDLLARRLPPSGAAETLSGQTLMDRLAEHQAQVRELYDRVIHAQKPLYYTAVEPAAGDEPEPEAAPGRGVAHALDQRAPQLASALAAANLHRGRERFEHFLEKAFASPELLDRLNGDAALAARLVELYELSSYFGDELLRYPELALDLDLPYGPPEAPLEDGASLRRYYRRQMLRIQAASVFGSTGIFKTLEETSQLADTVIAAAYDMAIAQAPPPSSAGYTPSDQMMVIALGRLGMREFDLGSDADLVFVIPDADMPEHAFWTGVAERMIHTLSAYTGEGTMFTVDTRLRPNGREGDLVQSDGAYKTYFGGPAEAWEGITYMKSRAVAGNLDRTTEFLHQLQRVDWRRYGQGLGSKRDLATMRSRLEKEQGSRNPLKAGLGGYYDIDFALMFLRLKGAGIFYKVLNTPARIDVIEEMGHLEPQDAGFLRDAATFYRAVDHGQRISTGHTEGSLPTSPAQMEILTRLVHRWTPAQLHEKRLDATLRDIRKQTRDFFHRLFGK
jgi:glutamate-ammonia-ligase adenylyltransferase